MSRERLDLSGNTSANVSPLDSTADLIDPLQSSANTATAQLLASLPVATVLLDGDEVCHINPKARQLIGRASDVDRILSYVSRADRDVVGSMLRLAQYAEHTANILDANGKMHLVRLCVAPLAEASHARVLCIVDLSTFRQKFEEDERSARLQNLGMVVSGVAHKISNPLAFVLPALEELCDLIGEEELDRELIGGLITDATAGVRRVVKIVQDLRNCGRGPAVTDEPVDLNALVIDTIDLARPKVLAKAGLRHDLGLVPTLPGSVGRVGQVLLNLILNAVNAMPERPAKLNRILIRTFVTEVADNHDHEEQAVLEVSDNGCGIASDALPYLFDPFYSRSKGGSGLGLAICQQILQNLGGSIDVASQVDVGSTFVVKLPLTQAQSSRRVDGSAHASNSDRRPRDRLGFRATFDPPSGGHAGPGAHTTPMYPRHC